MVPMIELLDDFHEEDGTELEEQWQQQLRQKQQQQGRQGQKEENEKQIENNKEVEGDKNKNKKALKPDSPTTEKAETQKGTKMLRGSVEQSGTEHDTTHTGIKGTDIDVKDSRKKIANNEKISDNKK
jgi:hypothetical protein